MRTYILVYWIIILAIPINVQATTVDSLLLVLQNIQQPIEKSAVSQIIDIHLQLIDDYIKIGNYSLALHYIQKLDKEYGELLSHEQQEFFLKSKKMTYVEGGDYNEAQEVILNLLQFYQSIGNQKGISDSYYSLGNLSFYQKEYQQGLEYLDEAIRYRQKIKDTLGIAYALDAKGCIWFALKNYDKAVQLSTTARTKTASYGKSYLLANISINLSNALMEQGQLEVALPYLNEALQIADSLQHLYLCIDAHMSLGKLYAKLEKYQIGQEHLIFALDKAEKHQLTGRLIFIYEALQQFYHQIGNDAQAYQFLLKQLNQKDTLYSKEKAQQLSFFRAKYDTERQERLNGNLLNQLKTKEYNNSLLMLGCLFLVLLFGAILYFYFQKHKYNKRLEQEVSQRTEDLVHLNVALKDANTELEQFTYMMSHDLKEPLRNLVSFSHLLEKHLSLQKDSTVVDYLHYISHSARQMNKLIVGILSFLNINRTPFTLEPCDLNFLLKTSIDAMQAFINHRNGQIQYSGDASVLIIGHPEILIELFKNLIEKGLKYNQQVMPTIVITATIKETYCELSFADNGIGIPSEYREQVFKMFKRLHTRSTYEGTGLGLAIAKKIVHKHGGKIWIETNDKMGTRVCCTLPLAQDVIQYSDEERMISSSF